MPATTAATIALLGMLFQVGARPNMLLKMIGAFQNEKLGGIIETTAREFPIGVYYQLAAPSQPAVLEGANAPVAGTQTITQDTNVIQLYHEAVGVTYLAEGDKTVTGVIPIPMGPAQGEAINPRSMDFQLLKKLEKIARDVNYTSLRGVFANPADPSGAALRSRGILTAITTNIVDKTAVDPATITAAIYRGYFESLMMAVVMTNGYNPDKYWVVFCDTQQYANLQRAYYGLTTPPFSREVAGMQIRELHTNFGTVMLVLEPDMPANTVAVFNLSQVGLVGLPVPGKGVLFNEALAKTGTSDNEQIYGQLGLDHAPEFQHGKLTLPAGVALAA